MGSRDRPGVRRASSAALLLMGVLPVACHARTSAAGRAAAAVVALPSAECVQRAAPPPAGVDERRGQWRLLRSAVGDVIGVMWCPASSGSCTEATHAGAHERLAHVVVSPDRQSVGMFKLGAGECTLVLCSDEVCGTPIDSGCNPSNGSLLWLPTGSLLYRGSGGSSISVAALYSAKGRREWSSMHVADELSPSHRYLLVGEGDSWNATLQRLVAVELARGRTLFSLDVPSFSRVTWAGDALVVSYAGHTRRMPLPGAGKLEGDDRSWRPLSK